MEDQPTPDAPRPPVQNDLVRLCRELNDRGARYLAVGGFAVMHHGSLRAADAMDPLLEGTAE
mgnify:CR=1 FL=1